MQAPDLDFKICNSHPACIRTLKHCITILFEEQQIVRPRLPVGVFPKRSSNRSARRRGITGTGEYKVCSNVRSPTTACHLGSSSTCASRGAICSQAQNRFWAFSPSGAPTAPHTGSGTEFDVLPVQPQGDDFPTGPPGRPQKTFPWSCNSAQCTKIRGFRP